MAWRWQWRGQPWLQIGHIPEKLSNTLQVLKGHVDEVTCVATSPDGSLLASGSGMGDNTVRVWNSVTGECVQVLSGHNNSVTSVAFGGAGRLASAAGDKLVRVWETNEWSLPLQLAGHSDRVSCLAWFETSPILASGSWDGTARVWDVVLEKGIMTLRGHTQGITCVAWNESKQLATGSIDTNVRVWDAANAGECLFVLKGHTERVSCIAWCNNKWVSASNDKTFRIWQDGLVESVLNYGQSLDVKDVLSFSWRTDGKLAVASRDAPICIWNWASGKVSDILRGHTGIVTNVAWSNEGRLVSCATDKTIRVWQYDGAAWTQDALQPTPTHTDRITCVVRHTDGTVVSGSFDQTVRVWSPDGQCLRELRGHTKEVTCVAISPDSRVVSGCADGVIRLWPGPRPDFLTLTGHTGLVMCVGWGGNSWVASGGVDKVLRVWDGTVGSCVKELRGHSKGIFCLAWSLEGTRIATGSLDHTVRIWDGVGTNGCLLTLSGHTGWVSTVAWGVSMFGEQVFSCGLDNSIGGTRTLRRWNAETGELIGMPQPLRDSSSGLDTPDTFWSLLVPDEVSRAPQFVACDGPCVLTCDNFPYPGMTLDPVPLLVPSMSAIGGGLVPFASVWYHPPKFTAPPEPVIVVPEPADTVEPPDFFTADVQQDTTERDDMAQGREMSESRIVELSVQHSASTGNNQAQLTVEEHELHMEALAGLDTQIVAMQSAPILVPITEEGAVYRTEEGADTVADD